MEATQAGGDKHYLDLSRLHRADWIGFAGAAVLLISLFLPWFGTDSGNPNSLIAGSRGSFTAWEVYGSLDWLLLAACTAPFVLAWIIARGHALSWRPGEVTMIVGITAFTLIILNGIVLGKPGDTVGVGFKIGYFVGLLGAALICIGGVIRQAEGARSRKPPGTF